MTVKSERTLADMQVKKIIRRLRCEGTKRRSVLKAQMKQVER